MQVATDALPALAEIVQQKAALTFLDLRRTDKAIFRGVELAYEIACILQNGTLSIVRSNPLQLLHNEVPGHAIYDVAEELAGTGVQVNRDWEFAGSPSELAANHQVSPRHG